MVLIVTGGGRGIGAATCRLAALRGYSVCINYLESREAAEALAAEIGNAIAVQADVGLEADVARLFERAERELGPVTALVNNAATLEPQMRLEGMDAARITRMFQTNLLGTMLCSRQAVRRMKGGCIVNISSGAAKSGSPGEYVDYAAMKGAVETFTVGLAKEVAEQGIRVNCVRPGFIYTDFHAKGGEAGRVDRVKSLVPMGRGGQASEVAEAVIWLLSDAASYVTGAFLDVAGGR